MKIFSALILAALVCVGCSDYKKPIAAVLQQRDIARQDATDSVKSLPRKLATKRAQINYFQKLQSIDVTACPKKFRDAWEDYVAAYARMNTQGLNESNLKMQEANALRSETKGSIGGTYAGLGATVSHDNVAAGQATEANLLASDPLEQWLNVRKVSADYGVAVPD